jgi:hypothetical protein
LFTNISLRTEKFLKCCSLQAALLSLLFHKTSKWYYYIKTNATLVENWTRSLIICYKDFCTINIPCFLSCFFPLPHATEVYELHFTYTHQNIIEQTWYTEARDCVLVHDLQYVNTQHSTVCFYGNLKLHNDNDNSHNYETSLKFEVHTKLIFHPAQMIYHEVFLHKIHSGIVLDEIIEAIKSNPPWVLRQASHSHIRSWIPSMKTFLGCWCNHCTTTAFISSFNLNLQPLVLSWGGWTHGSHMTIALGCMGHLPTHGAHCALDSVGIWEWPSSCNMMTPSLACQNASETHIFIHSTNSSMSFGTNNWMAACWSCCNTPVVQLLVSWWCVICTQPCPYLRLPYSLVAPRMGFIWTTHTYKAT